MSSGASPSIATQKGDTSLHIAVRFGHTDIAQVLVKYGSPVNQKDAKGRTARQIARTLGDDDMMDVLKIGSSVRISQQGE